MWHGVVVGSAVALIVALLGACSATTRIDGNTSADTLAKSSKGVAVLRIGAASSNCQHVGVWLGTREGPGFRPHKPVAVIHAGSLDDVPVAEVELDPGEYHVISYACGTGSGARQVQDFDRATGLSRTSYASFAVAAGEVVNVGSFQLHAARVGVNAFGRAVRSTVSVEDWPRRDLERYREKRPQIYAQMRTRLMAVTVRGPEEAGTDDCEALRRLQVDGKVQNLPVACAAAAAMVPGRRP